MVIFNRFILTFKVIFLN